LNFEGSIRKEAKKDITDFLNTIVNDRDNGLRDQGVKSMKPHFILCVDTSVFCSFSAVSNGN